MSNNALSREQFQQVQIARGLTTDEIIAKSGIPAQSFMVLMESDGRDGRDPSMLISNSTFSRLAQILGLEPDMSGLRSNCVIEWRTNPKTRAQWEESVSVLRKDLFSANDIEIAVLVRPAPLLKKKSMIIFLHDLQSGVKVAVTNADKHTVRFVQSTFGCTANKVQEMEPKEFDLTCRLIENNVYRSNQFLIVLGGRKVKYSWVDVQAAAKEFNYTTDQLIELMVSRIYQEQEKPPVQEETDIGLPELPSDTGWIDRRRSLRLASGG